MDGRDQHQQQAQAPPHVGSPPQDARAGWCLIGVLSQGAVCFSRKFTLQEIQDRWTALLYDPEISTQATWISCNSGDLGFLVAPCSCKATGSEFVCGGRPNNIKPELNSVNRYGQVGSSYNGGHAYSEMNGQSFHTKHTERMARDGDGTNNVVYDYSDVGQLYEHHAYAANNHGNGEGNNVSLKSITNFQDSMQFQQLDNNQCGNGVVDSKALVITNHFSGSVQEPMPLQVIGQPEDSEAPGGAIWSGVQRRDRLTLADDKNVKSENRDPLTSEANLDGGMSGLDHTADFMDFPFFNNSEDFDILNSDFF